MARAAPWCRKSLTVPPPTPTGSRDVDLTGYAAAGQPVVLGTALEGIAASAAWQRIIARCAASRVIVAAAGERVAAGFAGDISHSSLHDLAQQRKNLPVAVERASTTPRVAARSLWDARPNGRDGEDTAA
jgi:hypothetical protein